MRVVGLRCYCLRPRVLDRGLREVEAPPVLLSGWNSPCLGDAPGKSDAYSKSMTNDI